MKTEINELEELRISYKQCLEENRKNSRFVKNISSHLQLPLNQLIQFSNIALQRIRRKQTELSGDYLVEIKWISEELAIYINDLMELSQLKIGESEFALEEVDIVYFLDTMRRQFQPIADNRNISFAITSDIECPYVLADYTRLAKVVNILLRNAFRSAQDKGIVEIHVNQKGRDMSISIFDNGTGISQEKKDSLFNVYDGNYDQNRTEGMMDFSLSICKELMLGQNGDIYLEETQNDNNTRFVLSLPVAQTLLD
ncbi:MAG: signal transduction histidine kinase [Chlamydiales bacterium]|jgi:signal transduction histidine kinase